MRVADAPWCGHCKKLAPEYAEAASRLADEQSTVRLAKIDASFYRDVTEKYSIAHFPTMKLFVDKLEAFVYQAKQRTASAIVSWLKKRLAKYPATFVRSVQAAYKSIASNELVAFGFFKASRTIIIIIIIYSLSQHQTVMYSNAISWSRTARSKKGH